MHIVSSEPSDSGNPAKDSREAERYALMMQEVLLDIDDLDPIGCPPDRRILLGDREAWIYEHGNICELVYVNTGNR